MKRTPAVTVLHLNALCRLRAGFLWPHFRSGACKQSAEPRRSQLQDAADEEQFNA